MRKRMRCYVLAALAFNGLLLAGTTAWPVAAQSGSRYFAETGHTVRGAFLAYWDAHGGLAQQGYPLTDEVQEVSPLDQKTYTMQYFERAVFEAHPENKAPYQVLLSQVGTFRYQQRYPDGVPNPKTNATRPLRFPQTGYTVGGLFRTYWEQHGGLAQQGYPISEELQEISDLDGKPYTVQYFERAVFEWHPENKPPYDVLLTQLGRFRWTIRQAKQAAAKLPSPPRIYANEPGGGDYWPDDTGSVTQFYSTCGAAPVAEAQQACRQPMTLTTAISGAGAALEVRFSARWAGGQHVWLLRVESGKATFVQETGDPLPPLPQ